MSQETDALIAAIYPYSNLVQDRPTSVPAPTQRIDLHTSQEVVIEDHGLHQYDFEQAQRVLEVLANTEGFDAPEEMIVKAIENRNDQNIQKEIRVEQYNPAIFDPNSAGGGVSSTNSIIAYTVTTVGQTTPKILEAAKNEFTLVQQNRSLEQNMDQPTQSKVKISRVYNSNAMAPKLESPQPQPDFASIESPSTSESNNSTAQQLTVETNNNPFAQMATPSAGGFSISYNSGYRKDDLQ